MDNICLSRIEVLRSFRIISYSDLSFEIDFKTKFLIRFKPRNNFQEIFGNFEEKIKFRQYGNDKLRRFKLFSSKVCVIYTLSEFCRFR